MWTHRISGSVTAQCLRSYGAGPDVCKGTAGIYLAFVYWLLPFNCLLLLSHFRVNSNFFYIRERQSAPLGCILSGIVYIVVSSCFDICSLGSMHLELVYE